MSRAVAEWRSAVLKAGLPIGAEDTALLLAKHMVGWGGEVAVPERQLAREGQRSRSAVWKHLRLLEQAGLIRRSTTVGQRRTSVYVLQFPEGFRSGARP